MTEELRKTFHEELESIKNGIIRMAGRVSEAIVRGTDAFLAGDMAEAESLIGNDDVIDAMSIELEERCYQVLALQQPMASDLRAITGALWINGEIERCGDLMSNICKAARRMHGSTINPSIRGLIQQMSDEAGRLFRLSIDSYIEGDSGLASALDDIDDRLDELNEETTKAVLSEHTNSETELKVSVQLALVGRYYERIGDHSVNIGERVSYIGNGWMPENTGAIRAQHRIEKNIGAKELDGDS